MKKLSIALFVLIAALIISPVALADTVNLYTVGDNGAGNASMSLYLTVASGVVTGASGTITFGGHLTETVNGLVSTGTSSSYLPYPNTSGLTYDEAYGNHNLGPGTTYAGGYDQKISGIAPFVDTYGLALTLTPLAGNTYGDEVQIWAYTHLNVLDQLVTLIYVEEESVNNSGSYTVSTYQDAPSSFFTPEPGTLTLFGTGLLGLAGILRFKFGKKTS
jgi:hypothetical protein